MYAIESRNKDGWKSYDGKKYLWYISKDYLELIETSKNNIKEASDIEHPSYYQSSKFEVIDIIEEFKFGFNLGNVVKYILRAGKKDPTKYIEDLKKAKWYLEREINNLEKV